MIFGLKRCGRKATEKRKAKTINCHYPDISWKFKMSPPVKFSHKFSPLFNRFSTFDKNVNLSKKTNPEAQRHSFSPSPRWIPRFFYDISKKSEHINTFQGAPTQESPFQIQNFNFLERKKANAQNEKVFKLFP